MIEEKIFLVLSSTCVHIFVCTFATHSFTNFFTIWAYYARFPCCFLLWKVITSFPLSRIFTGWFSNLGILLLLGIYFLYLRPHIKMSGHMSVWLWCFVFTILLLYYMTFGLIYFYSNFCIYQEPYTFVVLNFAFGVQQNISLWKSYQLFALSSYFFQAYYIQNHLTCFVL